MKGALLALLGIIGWIIVTLAKKPGWKRMGEKELREAEEARERRFRREADAIVISLLRDRPWPDLARVAAMRAAGEVVRIATVDEEGKVLEVLDVP